MKEILVFGTFDSLHKGHLNFFKQAKKHGGYLVVVVARDKTVEQVKGRLPKKDEFTRLKEVEHARNVDGVRLGYLNDPYRVILEERPDIICLGYDQESFTDGLEKFMKENRLDVDIVKLKAYKPEKYKSSLIE